MAGDGEVGRTQWGFIVCRLSAVHSCSEHGINNRAAQWALLKCSHYKQSTNNRPAATFSPNYISGPGGRGDSPIFSPCVILWHYICVTIERDFGCSLSIIAFAELDFICLTLCRHSKDWVCRIDVRRTFGTRASQIQSAVNIATDFLAQQPKEKIELFFRRGTYLIDSKVGF